MRKRTWLVALVSVAILVVALGAGSAFAHGPAESDADWQEMEGHCPGMGGGWGMGYHHMGLADPVTLERVAGTLGLTYEELANELAQGKTIAQVAEEQGIDSSLVIATILAPQSEILEIRVKYGYLSEAQAQAILEQARYWVERAILTPLYAPNSSSSYAPRYAPGVWGGLGGMMGGGMMGGGMMHGGMMGGW